MRLHGGKGDYGPAIEAGRATAHSLHRQAWRAEFAVLMAERELPGSPKTVLVPNFRPAPPKLEVVDG